MSHLSSSSMLIFCRIHGEWIRAAQAPRDEEPRPELGMASRGAADLFPPQATTAQRSEWRQLGPKRKNCGFFHFRCWRYVSFSRSRAFSMRSQTHSPVLPPLNRRSLSFSRTGRRIVRFVISSPGYFGGRWAGRFFGALIGCAGRARPTRADRRAWKVLPRPASARRA